MSDTPETDKAKFTTYSTRHEKYIEAVTVDFARAQEREINRLRSIIRGKTFVTPEPPINGSAREGRDDSPASVAHAPAGPARNCDCINEDPFKCDRKPMSGGGPCYCVCHGL